MTVTLDLSGLDKRLGQLRKLNAADVQINAAPLMLTWMQVIDSDNRQGVLLGTDKDGVMMVPVTYRPKAAPGLRVSKPPKMVTGTSRAKVSSQRFELAKMRRGMKTTARKGMFAGLGSWTTAPHNNLTSAQYRLLGGPPLAPRDQFSRVITNLKMTFGGPPQGSRDWFAEGAWDEVVDVKGQPFLRYHFDGTGRLPRRDLRGVRPQGIAKALDALRAWAKDAVRQLFP